MNKKTVQKLIFCGLFLFLVGAIGFLITFDKNEIFAKGTHYEKKWKLSNQTINKIKLTTNHDTNVQFKKSTTGKNYVELSGNYSKDEIKQVKNIKVKEAGKTLNLSIKQKAEIFSFGKVITSSKQKLTVYLTDQTTLDKFEMDANSADTMIENVKARQFSYSSSSASAEFKDINTKNSKIESGSGDMSFERVSGKTDIDSSSGDIIIKQAIGELDVTNNSGDIKLTHFTGKKLYVQNNSGNNTLNKIKANIEMQASSGDINVVKLEGALAVKSHSGDITLKELTGSLKAEASSGDIDTVMNKPGKNLHIKTKSGNIELTLPQRYQAIYNAKAESGKINVPESKLNTKNIVTLITASGDIQVNQ